MKYIISKRLLAKSYDREKYGNSPPDYALLRQHSRDVAAASNALAETFGRIALFNACVNSEAFEQFRLALKANGWIQDLGKANNHFQKMAMALRPRFSPSSMVSRYGSQVLMPDVVVLTLPVFRAQILPISVDCDLDKG